MSPEPQTIFEQTYHLYLDRIKNVDLAAVAAPLGAMQENDGLRLRMFDRDYRVAATGIVDSSGRRPSLETCVILCQYILRCPPTAPRETNWVAYRDFKEAGPLTTYFANDVERSIAQHFSGDPVLLQRCAAAIGGRSPEVELNYDLCAQLNALPRIPLLLLFNDADAEFGAQCSVLFERRAEMYLDAESLAIAGRMLYVRLVNALL